jgi:hypothetical protein
MSLDSQDRDDQQNEYRDCDASSKKLINHPSTSSFERESGRRSWVDVDRRERTRTQGTGTLNFNVEKQPNARSNPHSATSIEQQRNAASAASTPV